MPVFPLNVCVINVKIYIKTEGYNLLDRLNQAIIVKRDVIIKFIELCPKHYKVWASLWRAFWNM